MAEQHQSDVGRERASEQEQQIEIGLGWRLFQIIALVVAVSWLASYVLFGTPLDRLMTFEWGQIVWVLSPVISIFIIGMAVVPEKLAFIHESGPKGYGTRFLLFLIATLWMVNIFIDTPMVTMLFEDPQGASKMIPLYAGVFLHVVVQHWLQALAAISIALVPAQFATLTQSSTPGGVQCAVIDCE